MKNKTIPENHTKRLKAISMYIRELRFSEGMTQQQVGEYSNLHRNSIVRAENAKNISLLSLFEIADTMEISLKELFLEID
jgi:transcriptional regulator with XRE-family HTH domain